MIKTPAEMIAQAQTKINCLDIPAAKALYSANKEAVIIDVREAQNANDANDANDAKLNASINIPRGVLEMQIAKHCPQPNSLILMHCAGGGRATLAALTLQDMGYTNVHAITAKFEDIKTEFD